MGSKSARNPNPNPNPALDVKPSTQNGVSSSKNRRKGGGASKHVDYRSDGVKDNDVLLLPRSDYKVMLLLTALATAVRLFKIYQPSSVVFDEVQ